MSEKLLPFALILATIVGSAIAVFVTKLLDGSKKRDAEVIGFSASKSLEIFDFATNGIQFNHEKSETPIQKLYENQIGLMNVGFETVSDFEVKLHLGHGISELAKQTIFKSYAETSPKSMKVDFKPDFKNEVIVVSFPFLKRGDCCELRIFSDCDIDLKFDAHHPTIDFRELESLKVIPTMRQKLGSTIASTKILEAVAVSLSIFGFLSFIGRN